MKIKIFSILLILGIITMATGSVSAAEISEIQTQVSVFYSSGEIKDADYKADLQVILDQAMIAEMTGNAEGMVGYLDAFTVLLQESTTEMITPEAVSTLLNMVP
jgi:hypothetical protein